MRKILAPAGEQTHPLELLAAGQVAQHWVYVRRQELGIEEVGGNVALERQKAGLRKEIIMLRGIQEMALPVVQVNTVDQNIVIS
jgi:hypothetical protein